MPLHDVGYRAWEGTKNSQLWRWWVIASVGVRLAFRSTWLSRTLLVSWVPAVAIGIGFFFYEQSLVDGSYRQPIHGMVLASSGSVQLAELALQDPAKVRQQVWASLLLTFFRYPQAFVMLIVIGIVAPRLISYDLRNRGYLLYFSRPIQIWEYIFGKSLIIWIFLSLITTVPALMLYVVGLSLSPQAGVILLTWDLPIRVLVASLVLMVPTTAVALACSSMTIESRYAAFSWFALWIVGWVSYSILSFSPLAARADLGSRPASSISFQTRWELLSPYHLLGRVQQWVFGLYPDDRSIWPYLAVLASVTLVSVWFIHRQLRSRLQS